MLPFVPYTFDLYRNLPRHTRDSAARMVSFARRDGVCWFSVRTFARVAGISKSSASRHLDLLTRPAYGFASRRRAADGSGYEYTIGQRWLARGAVSHGRAPRVPRAKPKEYLAKNKGNLHSIREAERPDDHAKWAQRVRAFRRSGFWLVSATDDWGPKPGEAGCQVPPDMLV